MIAAEISTRTPMSTGLVRIAMCRRLHSSTSQAAPSRPGAAMTASAVSRVPSSRTTPVARSSLSPAGFSARIALDAAAGEHLDLGLELRAHAREDVVGALGAHVAHRRLDERHAVEERLAAELVELLAAAVDLLGGAVLEPDAVDVADELGEALPADEAVEPAADVRRERELAVAEGAGAAPAAGDVAGLAAGADAGLARRAAAAVDVGAALDDEHLGAVAPHQLERGEDAGGAGADDDHVVVRACGVHRPSGGGGSTKGRAVPLPR